MSDSEVNKLRAEFYKELSEQSKFINGFTFKMFGIVLAVLSVALAIMKSV